MRGEKIVYCEKVLIFVSEVTSLYRFCLLSHLYPVAQPVNVFSAFFFFVSPVSLNFFL